MTLGDEMGKQDVCGKNWSLLVIFDKILHLRDELRKESTDLEVVKRNRENPEILELVLKMKNDKTEKSFDLRGLVKTLFLSKKQIKGVATICSVEI